MTAIVGARVTGSWTADELVASGVGFGAGDRHVAHDGKEYVFVKASAAISQYDVCTFDETYITTVAPISESNDAIGDKVGVAPVAIASGSYGWLQVYGPCTMNVKASCAANVKLNTTATAGYLDDDNASAIGVFGVVLTAARAASDGSAAGNLNYPYQDLAIA